MISFVCEELHWRRDWPVPEPGTKVCIENCFYITETPFWYDDNGSLVMVVPLNRDPFAKGLTVVNFGTMKIKAIKGVRAVTGIGLKEAKDFVESLPRDIRPLVLENGKYTLAEARVILHENGCTLEGDSTLAEILADLDDFVLPPAR